MVILNKILSNIFILVTVLSFVISTTGFASFKHHCTHHKTVSAIIPDSDECCSAEMIVNNAAQEECCYTDLHCVPKENHSKCCTDEMTYYRLSELFAPSGSDKQHLTCKTFIVKVMMQVDMKVDKTINVHSEIEGTEIPSSCPPKYILYHRAKFDPPLI